MLARRPYFGAEDLLSPPSRTGWIKTEHTTFTTTLDPTRAPQIKLRTRRYTFNIIELENSHVDATYHIDAAKPSLPQSPFLVEIT